MQQRCVCAAATQFEHRQFRGTVLLGLLRRNGSGGMEGVQEAKTLSVESEVSYHFLAYNRLYFYSVSH